MSNYDNIPTQRVNRGGTPANPVNHAEIEDIGLTDGKTRVVLRPSAGEQAPIEADIFNEGMPTVRVPSVNEPVSPTLAPEATRMVRRSRHANPEMPASASVPPVNDVAARKKIQAQDFPMGILVVISGAMQGSILTVGIGQNSIGRSPENHICMADDPYVSGVDHAFLTCRIDEGKFSIRPGNGRGIVYLNDEFLESSTLLKEGDIIRLTSRSGVDEPTQLMFLPVIRDNFRWPL